MRRSTVTFALCCAPSLALATPPRTASLSWSRVNGSEACVGASELSVLVEQVLGRTVFVSPSSADLSVEGHIEPHRGGFRAVIAMADRTGEILGTRELSTEKTDCRSIDESVTLALALMIDPNATLQPKFAATPEQARELAPNTVYVPVPVPYEVEVQVPTGPRQGSSTSVRAGAGAGFGWAPGTALSVVVGALWTPPNSFPFEFTLGFLFPREIETTPRVVNGEPSPTTAFSNVGASVFACPLAFHWNRFFARGCAGWTGGVLIADTHGIDRDAQSDSGLRAATGPALRAGVDVRLKGPFWFGVAGQLVAPLIRNEFVYRTSSGNTANVFETPPVQGNAEAAVIFEFP